MNKLLTFLREVNLWKTLWFNLHYFPLKVALHLPVMVYKRTIVSVAKGSIVLDASVKTGMVLLGVSGLGLQDAYYSRTIWNVAGRVVIKGKASIGRGTKILVAKNGTLTLGNNFRITGRTELICREGITFGEDCLLSWDILMMDTDYHYVIPQNGERRPNQQSITVGNHVWIGCRNTILKGVKIADNTIVAANSTLTKSIAESHCVVAGKGEVVKRGVDWEY